MIGEDIFIVRDNELKIFEDLLQQAKGLHIWNIYGLSGIGKSKLINFLLQERCNCPKVIVRFETTAYSDYRNVLNRLVNDLSIYGDFSLYSNLKEELYGPYYQPERQIDLSKEEEEEEKVPQSQYGWFERIISLFSGEKRMQSDNIEITGHRDSITVVASRGAKVWIGSPKYQELPTQEQEYLRHQAKIKLTGLFIECVNKMITQMPVVLFFDSFERTEDQIELIEWLQQYLLGEETGKHLANAIIVISGQQELAWNEFGGTMRKTRLLEFLPKMTEDYLKARGISNSHIHDQIHHLTYGHPLCVKLAANLLEMRGEFPDIDKNELQQIDSIETRNRLVAEFLVKIILNKLNNPTIRRIVEEGVILRRFDGDSLAYFFNEFGISGFEFQNLLDSLIRLSFVESIDSNWKFHDLIRELGIGRIKRIESHLKVLNEKALKYYLEKAADPTTKKIDSAKLKPTEFDDLMYHQFISSEDDGLRLFKPFFKLALRDHDIEFCERLISLFFFYRKEFGIKDKKVNQYIRWQEGELYRTKGDWPRAATLFEELLKDLDLEQNIEVAVVGSLGVLYIKLGKWEFAETFFKKCQELNRKMNNHLGEAMCLSNLGGVYQRRGDWEKAEKAFDESLKLDKELGNRHGEAMQLSNLGGVYQRLGDWEKAEKAFDESLRLSKELGNRHGEAMQLSNLGGVYQRLGDWEKAEKAFDESLRLSKELGDRHGEAMQLSNLGGVYQRLGDWEKAEKAFDESLRLNRELGDRHGEAMQLSNLGGVYQRLGDWEKAEKAFDESLRLHRELGNRYGEAMQLSNLGGVYQRSRDWEKALEVYQESLRLDEELGKKKGMAISSTNIGKIYQNLGEWGKALNYYKKSVEIDTDLGNKPGLALGNANVGKAYEKLKQWDQAMKHYKESLKINKELRNLPGIAKSLTNLGQISSKQGDFSSSIAFLKDALVVDQKLKGKPGIAKSLTAIGDSYKHQHEWDEALDYYQQSLGIERELEYKYGIYLNLTHIGEVYFWKHEDKQAFRCLTEACHIALRINSTVYERAINKIIFHMQRLSIQHLESLVEDFAIFVIEYWDENALDQQDPRVILMMEKVLSYFEKPQQSTLKEYLQNEVV